MRQENLKNPGEYGGGQHLRVLAAQAISSAELWMGTEGRTKLAAFFTAVASRITNGGSSRVESLPTPGNLAQGIQIRFAAARAVGYALYSASPRNRAALAAFFTDAASKVPGGVTAPVAGLRQAVIGTFLGETLNQTTYWYGGSIPFTNMVPAAAGSNVVVEFANKAIINGNETNGTGVFVIDDLGLEIGGVVYPAVLTKARAENATETAVATVTLPVALPAGEFRLAYRVHDSGGAKCFPHWNHNATSPVRQVFGSALPSAQTMVAGGGTWPAVAAGTGADVVLPSAVKINHAGKVLAVGGSSSGVGRGDNTLGSGVQGYLQRLAKDRGVPVLTTAVSGRRAAQLATSDTWLNSLLPAAGVTHYACVVGGNDINYDAATAAQVIANLNTHINRVKTAVPGIKVMIVTLTPVVSGTYDTLAGQTPNATTSIRLDANTQIKAGAITGADKVFDVTVHVETSQKFRVDLGGAITFDGLHVNGRGCAFIQTAPTAVTAMTEFLAL